MVEGDGLENRCTARYHGFESYLLRHYIHFGVRFTIHTLFFIISVLLSLCFSVWGIGGDVMCFRECYE